MKINYIIAACLGVAVLSGGYLLLQNKNANQSYEAEQVGSSTPDISGITPIISQEVPPVLSADTASSATATSPVTTAPAPKPVVKTDVSPAAPAPVPAVTPAPVAKPVGITMSAVASHNSAASCWSVIAGKVYDLTSYIPKHPGGKGEILAICGKDGSAMFEGQHGGDPKPERILASYYVDVLASN